jgi:hypothetical protein
LFQQIRWQRITEVSGIKLHETNAKPIELLQTPRFEYSNESEVAIDSWGGAASLRSHRVQVLNDFQKIGVTTSPQETLLFLSQQYHRAWRAEANHESLRTVIVNKFYHGIVLPPKTSEVKLFFRPFALWSLVPQLLFAALGAFLLLRRTLQFRRPAALRT